MIIENYDIGAVKRRYIDDPLIQGRYYYESAVKEIMKKVYTKEFIECNDERWNEIGLEFDEEDE